MNKILGSNSEYVKERDNLEAAAAAWSERQPPITNRGVQSINVSPSSPTSVFCLDWVRLTVWLGFAEVLPILKSFGVAEGLEFSGHGGIGFKQVYNGLNGFQLYAQPIDERYQFVSLNFPSKALHAVGMKMFLEGYSLLCEMGLNGLRWSCTRLDLAFDTQEFVVEQFAEAFHAGEIDTHTTAFDERRSKNKKKGRGYTFYLGSRESLAFIRVYLKRDSGSYGDEPCTRVEMQLGKERANAALLEILASPMAEWSGLAIRYFNGFLRISHEWWSAWVESVKTSWLKIRHAVPTVEKIERWLNNQVVASLTTYVSALAQGELDMMGAVVRNLLVAGRDKLTDKHEAMINRYAPGKLPDFETFAL